MKVRYIDSGGQVLLREGVTQCGHPHQGQPSSAYENGVQIRVRLGVPRHAGTEDADFTFCRPGHKQLPPVLKWLVARSIIPCAKGGKKRAGG